MNDIVQQLERWLPVRVQWQNGAPFFDWCYLGERRFTESFFDQTVESLFRYPFNLFIRPLTGVDVLEQIHDTRPGLKPRGFIFHLSRCGSTLVSQMLAALPSNVVVSEASPLDWMIRARVRKPDISDEEQINWIRWMMSALGQKRTADAAHFYVKFDAWHTFNLDLIERAFPDVPWIFLYRNPVEVMVSHNRQRGAGTVPGIIEHQLPGLSIEDSLQLSPDEYVARVLARVCEYALRYSDRSNALFVNYNQLPAVLTSGILKHFNVAYTDAEIEQINAAARFDAKSPTIEFSNDVKAKQREASNEIRRIADEMLMPLYEKLEAVRYNSR